MEDFRFAGVWKDDQAAKSEVVGILSFDRSEGFELEIPFGGLGGLDDFGDRVNQEPRTPLVHGTLRNGKLVTLVDALMTNSSLTRPGGRTETHSAVLGFVGPVACSANPVVDEVRVRYCHLRDWVVTHPSRMTRSTKDGQLAGDVQYHYEPMDPQPISDGDGWRLSPSRTWSQSFVSVVGFHVDQDCTLILEVDEGMDFEAISSRFLDPLWRFLSFCLDQSVDVRELEVRLAESGEWVQVGRAQTPSKDPDSVVHPAFMLVSMPSLGQRLADVVRTWLSFDEDQSRAVSLMVGLGSQRRVPSDLRFLAAAQALEAMSRFGADLEELDRREFNRRRRVVREAVVEKSVQDWAEGKLQYCNQRTAEALLRGLIEFIGPYAPSIAPDMERFLADHRSNRNFYTHRGGRCARPLLEPGELYVHTEGLMLLLKAATLRMLGYSPDETTALMGDCPGCSQWRREVSVLYAQPDEAMA